MNYSELGKINLVVGEDGTKVFRQKLFDQDDVQLQLKYDGRSFVVSNWSRTGINFQVTDVNFDIGQRVEGIEIFVNEHNVYNGTIEIKSKTDTEAGTHFGAAFLFNLFPIECVESLKQVDMFTHMMDDRLASFKDVDPHVCKVMLEMKHYFTMLKENTTAFEKSLHLVAYDERQIAERNYLEKMSETVHRTMVGFNKKVAELIDVDSIELNSNYHLLFHENIYPFVIGADYPQRAKEKPLGYAGDYEMMNQVYRGEFEGKDLFGKILHHYTATEISAQSVLFRRPYFCDHYKSMLAKKPGQDIHVLSLASGPCVEFQKLIEDLPQEDLSRIKLTLLDLDPKSLAHAQSKIYEQCLRFDKTVNIQFVKTSVKVFIEGTETFKNKFDLIYSGGLFDYLDNQISTAIVTNLYKLLNDGGRMAIGNFTNDDTTKAFCHLIIDWHLIHKTEDEIKAWAKYIPGAEVKIDYDPHEINAFMVLEK